MVVSTLRWTAWTQDSGNSATTLHRVSTEKRQQRTRPEQQEPGGSGPRPEAGPVPDPHGLRRLADPKVMRALAHPTRVRLLYEVGLHGTLTATQAAQIVGGTPAAAAYHLRTLGRYGFIQEAEGGTGRERPWKIGTVGITWDDHSPDLAEQAGARLLYEVMYGRWTENIERYHRRAEAYPLDVREVSGANEALFFVTVEEMREIQERLLEIAVLFQDRIADPSRRPPGALPFEMVTFTHPLSDPPESPEPPE